MGKRARKVHLNDEQATRLLKLGLHDSAAAAGQDPENRRKDLLSDMLCSKLPVDARLQKMLPRLIESLSDDLVAISGLSLKDHLTSPESKPAVLRRIKDHAKETGASTQDPALREVAKLVYFLAVATALVHHRAKISGHSYLELEDSFQLCSQQKWLPHDLKRLFVKAKNTCKQ